MNLKNAIHGNATQESGHDFFLQNPKGGGRQKTIGFVLLLALSCGVALGGKIDQKDPEWFMKLPVTRDLRPRFVLFSWTAQNDLRQFALISDRDGTQEHRFIDKFNARHTPGMSIRELEGKLAKLPKGCLISWMGDEPHKLDHANQQVVRRLKKFVERLEVDLQLNNYRYESPDV